MMLVGLVIAVFAGLGILLMSLNASNIAPAVVGPLMEPFLVMADKTFYFLAALLPILAAVIPLYILKNRDERVLVMGALYGLGLMAIVMVLGLDQHVVQLFRTSWYGSTIGTVAATLGPIAEALQSLLYGVALWLWGAFLAVIDAFLGGLTAAGRAAGAARGRVKQARRKAYGRIGDRI